MNVCEIEKVQETTVVRVLEKKIYQDMSMIFQNQMMDILAQGHRNILMDFSRVDVINSSGLGVLIQVWDRLSKTDGNLVLFGLSSFLTDMFERMKLDLLFAVAGDEGEALKRIREKKTLQ